MLLVVLKQLIDFSHRLPSFKDITPLEWTHTMETPRA